MAERTSPADETPAGRRTADESELLSPPTDAELAETGEPTIEEIRAAAGGDTEVIRPAETEVIRPASASAHAVGTPAAEPAEETRVLPAASEPAESSPADSSRAEPTTASPTLAKPTSTSATAAEPAASQPVLAPAAESAPRPPRRRGNRVVGTAWVLLAAGLFQVLYFAGLALIILLLGGAQAVGPGITNIAKFPFAWLPVLFFFLFFELTVLLFNRAGRFAYVVASLIVGLLVYIVSVLLISIIVGGSIGDTSTLAQAFESPEFVLAGLVAREVMLWTGFAIGSRGVRVRRRNKEDRVRYDEELGDA